MTAAEIEEITKLVSLQLAQAASEQEQARKSIYEMLIGITKCVDTLAGQVQKSTTTKAAPLMNEAIMDALVVGVRDLLTRSIAPLKDRIEALEQQLQQGGQQ